MIDGPFQQAKLWKKKLTKAFRQVTRKLCMPRAFSNRAIDNRLYGTQHQRSVRGRRETMCEGNVLFFKAKPRAATSDARMAERVVHADDSQGVVFDRFKGALLCLPKTWRRLLPPPRRPYKAAVILPNLLNDPESIIVLDLKTEAFTFSPSWRRRPTSLRLV